MRLGGFMKNLVADKNELIHVLDENGKETNVLENRKIVHEKGLWHNEVACVVINKRKQVLLQRRSKNKKSYPNCWALCAGHVVAYEDIKEAIVKEMREELVSEIKGDNIFLLLPKTKNEREDNKCFATCFCAFIDKPAEEFLRQKEEVEELRWFDFSDFKEMILTEKNCIFKNNEYYNNIIRELEKLFSDKNFNKKMDSITEKLEELDSRGNETGRIVTREFAHNFGIWHKAVSLFIINDKREVLLQLRSKSKIRNGGLWDISVSGHVLYNEDNFTALQRECFEESKYEIKPEDVHFLVRYKENRKFNEKFIDNCWFDVYYTFVDSKNKKIEDMEVDQNKFVSLDELESMMRDYKDLAYKPEPFNALISLLKSKNI